MSNDDSNKDQKIDKPIISIDTSKYRNGLSISELQRLSKQDPATLTPAQQKSLTEANESIKIVTQSLSSKMADFGKALSPSPGISSFLQKLPSVSLPGPLIKQYSPYSSLEPLDFKPDTSLLDEQAKQTAILEDIRKASQQPNAELLRLIEPRYDRKQRILIFGNVQLLLSADSDDEIICNMLFRGGSPVKHPVEKGDIMEQLQLDTHDKKALYNKVASLNRLVEKKTGVDKLFDFVDKKLWINAKYIKLTP